MAVRTGLSYETVAGIERGGRPSFDTFMLLIDGLDVEPHELFEEIPEDER